MIGGLVNRNSLRRWAMSDMTGPGGATEAAFHGTHIAGCRCFG